MTVSCTCKPTCSCVPAMGSVRKAVGFTRLVLGCTAVAFVCLLFARVLFTACSELTTIMEGKPVRGGIFEEGLVSTLFMFVFFVDYLLVKVNIHSIYQYQTRSLPAVDGILKLIKIIITGVAVIGSLFVYYVLLYAMAGATYEEREKNKAYNPNRVFESAIFSTFLTSMLYMGHKNIVTSLRALRDPEIIPMASSKRLTAKGIAAANYSYLSMITVFFLLYTCLHSIITFSTENLSRSKLVPGMIEAAIVSSLLTVLFFMGYILYKYRKYKPRQSKKPILLVRVRLCRHAQCKDRTTRIVKSVLIYEDEMPNRTAPDKNRANYENKGGIWGFKVTVEEVWSPNNPINPNDISTPPEAQDETTDQNDEGNTLSIDDEKCVLCA